MLHDPRRVNKNLIFVSVHNVLILLKLTVYFRLTRKSITPTLLGAHDDKFLDVRGSTTRHTFDIPLGTGTGKQ